MEQRMLSIQQDQASKAGSTSWLRRGACSHEIPSVVLAGGVVGITLPARNASHGRTADSEHDSSSQHPLVKGTVRNVPDAAAFTFYEGGLISRDVRRAHAAMLLETVLWGWNSPPRRGRIALHPTRVPE